MAYVALYRSYRPKSFNEVAGQEHITTTLRNALKNHKFSHAYLFSGPRGTGKTSIAKIVAKALNCQTPDLGDACNVCDSCLMINKNIHGDVIEIDAASNNGVDEIREIRDKVKYLPSIGKYKVYIIDEVHMLSTGAFNALLKTLEEPPKHAIFILATTEPYKLPATILSRCQRFDFRGIGLSEMKKRLNDVIVSENIAISDEAIEAIIKNADGGMRDALSLLDQAISFSENEISEEDVNIISGSINNKKLMALVSHIIDHNPSKALLIVEELLNSGKEVPRIINDLISFYRDVLIYLNVADQVFQRKIFKDEQFIALTSRISLTKIAFYLDVLNETQNNIKFTTQKRTYLELALIKMAEEKLKEDNVKINALELKIANLEKALAKPKNIIVKDKRQSLVDIKRIEEILHHPAKEARQALNEKWEKIFDNNTNITAQLMLDAEPVALSDKALIITIKDEALCVKFMNDLNQKLIKSLFLDNQFVIDEYYVIPTDKWEEIKNEYVAQRKRGIEKPIISHIKIELYPITEPVKERSQKPKIVQDAIAAFGENKVNVKG